MPQESAVKKTHPLLKWIRIHFFSGHLHQTAGCGKVLDMCCGWGFYFKINPDALGVDKDDVCVEYLSRQGYKVKQCDVVEGLPFGDDFFNMVLIHDTLGYFDDHEIKKIFEHVYSVLKQEGMFMIIVPNRKGYEYAIRIKDGTKQFITEEDITNMARGRFIVKKSYWHPLPEFLGRFFTNNKKVVILQKI